MRDTRINPGDIGVVIRVDGTIHVLLNEPNLPPKGQALLGAAFKVENDQAFREQQIAAFNLYHTSVEGHA